MSRIAEAYARAGMRLPVEDADRWEIEREIAARHVGGINSQLPTANSHAEQSTPNHQAPEPPPSASLEVGNWELGVRPDPRSPLPDFASAIRTIFLAPKSTVRSVFRLLTR